METPSSLVGNSTFAQALHDVDMDIPSCVDGNFTLLQSSSETAQIVSASTSLLNNQSVHDVGVGDSNISCWKLYLCTSIT